MIAVESHAGTKGKEPQTQTAAVPLTTSHVLRLLDHFFKAEGYSK